MTPDERIAEPPRTVRLGPHAGALCCYALLAGILLWPGLARGDVLSAAARWAATGPFPASQRALAPRGIPILSDSSDALVPGLRFGAEALAADGRLPLWKPTACCGAPYVGNGQSAVFFPLGALALLLGAPGWVFAAQAFTKLVAGAFGAWLLARHLKLSALASLLVGAIFGFGGCQALSLLYPLSSVALLLPFLLLAADRAVLRPSWPRLGTVALLCGLQHLAGHPETTLHCQLAAFGLATVRLLSLRGAIGGAAAFRRGALLAASFVVGALLGAVQILPLLEYVRESESLFWRHKRLAEESSSVPWPGALMLAGLGAALFAMRRLARAGSRLALWAPVLLVSTGVGLTAGLAGGLGGNFMLPLAPDWCGGVEGYRGPDNYVEVNGACAGAALGLALLGALAGRPRWLARTAGVLLGLGWLAGYRAPFVTQALHALPLLDVTENHRLLLLALLATAVLAGLGLDALGRVLPGLTRPRFLLAGLLPVLAALVALALGVEQRLLPPTDVPVVVSGSELVLATLLPPGTESVLAPAPGFPAARDPAPGLQRVFFGYVSLRETPTDMHLQYSAAPRDAPVSWLPVPPGPGGGPGPPGTSTWVFRASVADSALAPGPCRVRLRITLPDRVVWSGLMGASDEDTPDWLAFPVQPLAGRAVAQLLSVAAGAALALLLWNARGAALRAGRIALVLLVCGSLLAFAQAVIPWLPPQLDYPASPTLELLASLPPDGRMLVMKPISFAAEIPGVYGIPDVRGYDALQPLRVVQLLSAATGADPGAELTPSRQLPATRNPHLGLLGIMAVRYLVNWPSAPGDLPRVHYPGEDTLPPDDSFPIVANPVFLPRARLVTGAVVEPDDERALVRLAEPDFPRARSLVLASGEGRPPSGRLPPRADIVSSRPDKVDIEIRPEEPGWLVLADTFFPGWKVLVDGRERELLRANVAFRAVAVAPGDRLVQFRYEPRPLRVGAAISAAAGALVTGALLSGLRRRRVSRRG